MKLKSLGLQDYYRDFLFVALKQNWRHSCGFNRNYETATIFRRIMEKMNLSIPDEDPEDYIKNIGESHYEPSVDEIFTTRYARNRDTSQIVSDETWKTLGSSKLDTVPFKVSSASGDAVQLSAGMKCGQLSKEKPPLLYVMWLITIQPPRVGLD
ncbi:hypothetical protein ACTXT7_016083 [Hymenolepis weldensis]